MKRKRTNKPQKRKKKKRKRLFPVGYTRKDYNKDCAKEEYELWANMLGEDSLGHGSGIYLFDGMYLMPDGSIET